MILEQLQGAVPNKSCSSGPTSLVTTCLKVHNVLFACLRLFGYAISLHLQVNLAVNGESIVNFSATVLPGSLHNLCRSYMNQRGRAKLVPKTLLRNYFYDVRIPNPESIGHHWSVTFKWPQWAKTVGPMIGKCRHGWGSVGFVANDIPTLLCYVWTYTSNRPTYGPLMASI